MSEQNPFKPPTPEERLEEMQFIAKKYGETVFHSTREGELLMANPPAHYAPEIAELATMNGLQELSSGESLNILNNQL